MCPGTKLAAPAAGDAGQRRSGSREDILIGIGIAAFAVLCALVAAIQAGEQQSDEARHRPPSFREQVLMDAIKRGDLQDPYDDRSGQ